MLGLKKWLYVQDRENEKKSVLHQSLNICKELCVRSNKL